MKLIILLIVSANAIRCIDKTNTNDTSKFCTLGTNDPMSWSTDLQSAGAFDGKESLYLDVLKENYLAHGYYKVYGVCWIEKYSFMIEEVKIRCVCFEDNCNDYNNVMEFVRKSLM